MIKKFLLNAAAVATVCLVATSCSSEQEVISDDALTTGTQITLAFNDGGDTRAARPVYSSAAFNTVNEVKLSIFVENGTEWEPANDVTFTVNDEELTDGILAWTPAQTEGVIGTNTQGRNFEKQLTLKGLAATKNYRLVAYGYNKDMTTDVVLSGQTFTATPATNSPVEEIFAGRAQFSTDADGKIKSATTTVTMKRQVAGFLGYFTGIPTTVEGEKVAGVRVVASASNSAYTFTGETCLDPQNGINTTKERVTVYDMVIPEGATEVKGIYNFQQKIENVYVKPNSLLAGKFLVAFGAQTQTNAATFTVELYGTDTKTLKHWDVKNQESESRFNVNRNEFYMIGKKYTNGKPNPEDPTDPDPDPENPDEPIDLSTDSEMYIIINDAWAVIHSLTI